MYVEMCGCAKDAYRLDIGGGVERVCCKGALQWDIRI